MTNEEIADALLAAGLDLWSATLSPSPANRERAARMQSPDVGDLVVIYLARGPAIGRVGTLVAAERRPIDVDPEEF